MFSRTVRWSNIRPSWKMKPMLSERSSSAAQLSRSATATPPKSYCPSKFESSMPRMRSSVVLPEPLSPRMTVNDPAGMVRLISVSTRVSVSWAFE